MGIVLVGHDFRKDKVYYDSYAQNGQTRHFTTDIVGSNPTTIGFGRVDTGFRSQMVNMGGANVSK